jgi:tetratricopeptide (TPR) repeat protein
VKLDWQISAGEFFELFRPAALIISALLSMWVLASARRWNFRFYVAAAWALGTFLLPFVVLPLYLIVRGAAKRNTGLPKAEKTQDSVTVLPSPSVRYRYIVPIAYGITLFSLIALYQYHDHNSVDAHLARAEQAKLMNQRARAIREYRAALILEDNPHTHKLLGIELADARQWNDALHEFRAAERGGEPDKLLALRCGQVLEATGNKAEAMIEYQRFLKSHACIQQIPEKECVDARHALASAK